MAIKQSPSPFADLNVWSTGQFACDAEVVRFYLGNAVRGVVQAYASDGRELWTATLPGFRSLLDENLQPTDRDGFLAALFDHGCLGAEITVSGPYIAVSSLCGKRHQSAIYHRSGRFIGVVGPWFAHLVRSGTSGSWIFAASPTDTDPTEFVTVTVVDQTAEREVEHFIAWCLPFEAHTKLDRWKICDGLPADRIKPRLGDRYDPGMSVGAKRIHDALGFKWPISIYNSTHAQLGRLIATGNPASPTWDADLARGFLVAGADCDFERLRARLAKQPQ